MGCHPSHWRIPSFFRGVGQPPDQSWEIPRAPHGSCLIGLPCLDPAWSWQDATNQDWSAWNGTNGNAGASRGTFPCFIMANTQKAPQKQIPIESSNEGFYLQVNKTWSLVQQFTASPNRVRWWITEAGHVGGPKRWAEFWSIQIFQAVDDIWVLQILTMIWLNKQVCELWTSLCLFFGPWIFFEAATCFLCSSGWSWNAIAMSTACRCQRQFQQLEQQQLLELAWLLQLNKRNQLAPLLCVSRLSQVRGALKWWSHKDFNCSMKMAEEGMNLGLIIPVWEAGINHLTKEYHMHSRTATICSVASFTSHWIASTSGPSPATKSEIHNSVVHKQS